MLPIRTLRRIQIIVALMMILSMVVGSPAALAAVYGPNPPTFASDPGLLSDTDNNAGPRVNRGSSEWVRFDNPLVAGQTVLGVEIEVRGRRVPNDSSVSVVIRGGQTGGSALTSSISWGTSWSIHRYASSENDALRRYVQDRAGQSITFNVYNSGNSSSSRRIDIDWVKLKVTTAEPTVAPPEIVGSCAPANIHLVVDNSGSIGTGNLNTLKTNLKSFMLAVETAVPGTNWNVTKFGGSSASSSGWATSGLTLVNNFVDGMGSSSYTPTARGIQQARNQTIPSGSGALPKIMIILTDGAPNRRLSDSSGSTRYYYQGAADAIAQADLARGDGWTTFLVAIGSGDSDAPAPPYAANVNLGLAGSAANVMSTDFEVIRTDLLNHLASGCAIALEKEVDQDVVLPGTEVTYTYTVSNPMSVNLTNITLADDKCSPLSGPTGAGSGDGVLNPGEIWQYTCSQTITVVTLNTAVVTGTVASVGAFSDTDTATVAVVDAAIEVDKKAAPTSGYLGDTIVYSYDVTNAGSLPLSDIKITDDKCAPVAAATPSGDDGDGQLEEGETWKFTCSYTMLATDVLADKIVNTATVTGTASVGEATKDATDKDTATVTVLPFGALDVDKVVDWSGVLTDTTKTFEICITGPSHTTANCKDADYDGDTLSWEDLIPGTYTVTESYPGLNWNVSGNGVTVTVPAGEVGRHTITNTFIPSHLNVVKVVDWGDATPDTSKTFEICITGPSYATANCKNADYDGDTLTWDKLLPGTYTVTETNPGTEWTVSGSGVGVTVLDQGDGGSHTITNTLKLGGLDVIKVVDWNGVTPDASQTFTFTITGPSYPTGSTGKSVSDPDWLASWPGLAPGVYTVTETSPGSEWTVAPGFSQQVTVTSSITASVTFTNTRVQEPAIDLTKVANPTATDPGATVVYTLYYTNTGNIALTNVTLVDDPDETYVASITNVSDSGNYDGDKITWTIGDLAIGASDSVTYQATLKDDTAFEVGQTPVENTATIDSDQIDPVSDDATVTVTLLAAPSLGLTKQIGTSSTGPWLDSVTILEGADVYYRFTVTNTGNIELSVLSLEDDTFTPSCTWPSSLAAGASHACVAGPVTAQAGTHTNTAQAFAYNKEIASNTDTASYTGLAPAIEIVKTASVSEAYPGDTVTYSYVVTNTGAVTLTNLVLDDDKLGTIALGVAILGPGASTTGSASYTVTAGDAPEIVNTATVTGTATVGDASKDVTDSDTATVDVILGGSLTIIKDAADDTTATFGFTLDVDQPQLNILPRDGELPLQFSLKGGESRTFDLEPGYYTIAETAMPDGWVLSTITCDVEGGELSSLAADVGSLTGTGGYLGEGMAVTCTFSNRYPALTLAKEVATSAAGPWQEHVTVQVGSAIYYRLSLTNSGNAALSGLSVTDPTVDASGCAWPTELAPGASAACVVGPVEAEAGEHTNTAQALALFVMQPPEAAADGLTIYSNEDSAAYTGVVPGLEIAKSVAPASAAPGETVAYTVRYTNTGTMALTGVLLTDDPDETYIAAISAISDGGAYDGDVITWAIGDLAAGAGSSVTYQATMEDETAFTLGQTPVDNVAVLTADQAGPAQDQATVTVTRLLQPEPALSLQKVGSLTVAHIGDTVAYTLTVQNTGNITLTNVTVTDAKLGIDEAIGDLAPGASAQVTGSYTVTEADVAGIVNTATAASDQTEPVSDTWTVEVITGPALAIAKVGSATVAKPGDVVDYVLTVTNIGDVTLTNVTVVDAKLGIDTNVGSLAPGASAHRHRRLGPDGARLRHLDRRGGHAARAGDRQDGEHGQRRGGGPHHLHPQGHQQRRRAAHGRHHPRPAAGHRAPPRRPRSGRVRHHGGALHRHRGRPRGDPQRGHRHRHRPRRRDSQRRG